MDHPIKRGYAAVAALSAGTPLLGACSSTCVKTSAAKPYAGTTLTVKAYMSLRAWPGAGAPGHPGDDRSRASRRVPGPTIGLAVYRKLLTTYVMRAEYASTGLYEPGSRSIPK